MYYCFNFKSTESEEYLGYAGYIGKIFLIFISLLGILINLSFSVEYLKNIISIKNRDNAGISTVEKILCWIAIVETFISIFWLVNNFMVGEKTENACKIIAYFVIFLYLFDWLILSTSLYQIKIILLNPQQILESGKRVFKYIIICLIVSVASFALAIPAQIGGRSPMYTCFINLDILKEGYQKALFWLFFTIPLFCLLFGIFQIFLIMRSVQYKNDKNNREFFIEYSYFVITYIISSILLILVYLINYIIIKVDKGGLNNLAYQVFIGISTFLTCSTPLIVGVIRFYRTGLLKRICNFCKKRRANNNLIEEGNEEEELQINNLEEDEGGYRMFQIEKIILEKLIIKYFTAVSFALGKSKYKEEENDIINKNENISVNEKKDYKITREEILKDLDLSLNDDIKVLGEANIDIEVTEYNSSLFKKLRQLEGLNEDKIIAMFQPKKGTNQLIHKVNDSFYINSSNKLLMLKKIKREQMYYFQNNILPNLYDYFVNNPNSIICRIFGFYRIKIEQNDEIYMALIYNIHESIVSDELGFIEDKTLNMKATEAEFKSNLVIGLKSNESSSLNATAGTIITNKTFEAQIYKERKKKFFKLYLTEQENDKLDKIIKNDMDFFSSKNNNGYHFYVFEKEVSGNNIKLSSSGDFTNDTNNLDEPNSNIKKEIKKYVFNSNKPNSIYCICLSGI